MATAGILKPAAALIKDGMLMVDCSTENCVWLCKCTKFAEASSRLFSLSVLLETLGASVCCNRFLISSEADLRLM
ncbi:hypothetical protein D3C87_1574860 [compost metagenome]